MTPAETVPSPGAGAMAGLHKQGVRREVIPFWRAVFEIARKEVLMFVRTKRLYVMGGMYAFGFLLLSGLFAWALTGALGDEFSELTTAIGLSKANITMAIALFFPLLGAFTFLNILGLVFTFDGVVREHEDRSLFLILAKPVSREALVFGKFAGAAFTIGVLLFSIATVAYFLAMLIVGELPPLGDIFRYFLALGLIYLGILALAAMGLFSSSFCRTTVMSALFSFSMWLIVLSILANSGFLYAAITQQLGEDPWYVTATRYINPALSGGPAARIMLNLGAFDGPILGLPFISFNFDLDPLIMVFSLLGFTAVFLGATILIVQRRNFE